ncbi:MAG: trehalose-phosphatase [Pseudomonadota bacterium]
MYYEMIGFAPNSLSEPTSAPPLLDLDQDALFLDFDGTLIDLAPSPQAIEVPDDLHRLLARLHTQLGGRLALVSGRSVADLQKHLPSFPGILVGGHGAETRQAGRLHRHPLADSALIARVQFLVEEFTGLHPGVEVERKPTGVVAHYRQAPEAQQTLYKFFETLTDSHRDLHLQMAHCAYELRPADAGKDRAVARVMDGKVFKGARPVFIGDDLTDEPALMWCQDHDGLAIKVGDAATCATCRVDTPQDVRSLLERSLA